ncbi:hypothetical protein ACU5AX_02705 [Sphingomonas sp. XXL09]|uniref:hypothetical protein n=1 Tax=Sphingomonas sp. XXL09 TaxID=3457787 RepID=UPI00406BA0D4
MARPLSLKLFAFLFAASCLLSVALAIAASRSMTFGFALAPEAARVLARRIFWIRVAGIGFAITLFILVVFRRSVGARGTLLLRWFMALATSVALLRAIGVVSPEGTAPVMIVASIAQLMIEGLAILILYSPDASDWFDPRSPAFVRG